MSNTVIGPVIAFLILAVKLIFGIEIPVEIGGQITDAVVLVGSLSMVLYGIFKNHKKPKDIQNS